MRVYKRGAGTEGKRKQTVLSAGVAMRVSLNWRSIVDDPLKTIDTLVVLKLIDAPNKFIRLDSKGWVLFYDELVTSLFVDRPIKINQHSNMTIGLNQNTLNALKDTVTKILP